MGRRLYLPPLGLSFSTTFSSSSLSDRSGTDISLPLEFEKSEFGISDGLLKGISSISGSVVDCGRFDLRSMSGEFSADCSVTAGSVSLFGPVDLESISLFWCARGVAALSLELASRLVDRRSKSMFIASGWSEFIGESSGVFPVSRFGGNSANSVSHEII